jgi:hypothetical protein
LYTDVDYVEVGECDEHQHAHANYSYEKKRRDAINGGFERMHVATALKILQPSIDQVSHNRGERFRVRTANPDLDLTPRNFYALQQSHQSRFGAPTFIVAQLDKLVRIEKNKDSTNLKTASLSSPGLQVQWIYYELRDKLYWRTLRRSEQRAITKSSNPVIMGIKMDVESGGCSWKLATESHAELLRRSFVDATELEATIVGAYVATSTQTQRPKRNARKPAPKLPFQLNDARQITRLTDGFSWDGDGARTPAERDVVLSVGDARVESATDARTAMREALALEGLRVHLRFWRPPPGWVASRGIAPAPDLAARDAANVPEYAEVEMKQLLRLVKRLEGGCTGPYLKKMCDALAISADGGDMTKMRRVESELRARNFGADPWAPTTADVELSFSDAGAFDEKFANDTCKIGTVVLACKDQHPRRG